MKQSYKAAIGIFVLLVLWGIVSAGVFVVFGSQLAIYATVGALPILVVAIWLWVRRTIKRFSRSQTDYVRRRAREVGEAFEAVWKRREEMRTQYPGAFEQAPAVDTDGVLSELSEQGIEFDRSTGTVSLGRTVGPELDAINRLDDRVSAFETDLRAAFSEGARAEIQRIDRQLAQLDDVVSRRSLVDEHAPGPDETLDWETAADRLDACHDAAVATLEDAADAVEETMETTEDVDRESVQESLRETRTAAANGEFESAVTSLLAARDAIQREGAETFGVERRKLQSLLDTLADSRALEVVDGYESEIETHADAIAEMRDAMDMAALRERRQRIERLCLDVVEDLSAELDDLVAELRAADVPEGFYDVPEAHETDYAVALRSGDDLETLETKLDTALSELTAAIEDLEPKADVVTGYDRIEELIDTKLRSDGAVDATDLPVDRHEEQFLGLYYRKYPETVSFDIDAPRLVAAGGSESYDVDVTVEFDAGGAEREVTVSIAGDDYDDAKTVSTPLVKTVTFEEVPYGEYAVVANPTPPEYPRRETDLLVDGDSDVTLHLSETSLRERLCDGYDDDVARYLDDLAPMLADKFDQSGYLSTRMSYQIDDEYVPCLLATWANEQSHAVRELNDGRVIVYDRSTLESELENVVRYNLDEDGIACDDLRERFLSAPVPDPVVAELLASADVDNARIEGGTLHKTN